MYSVIFFVTKIYFITMVRKASISSFLIILFLLFNVSSAQAQDGKTLFKTNCAACHKTSSKKLIGPGLANINNKRSQEWFNSFVSASQSFINSGDADAIKIFEEYNKVIMPDQALSDADLNAIYEYIKSVSPTSSNTAVIEEEEEEIPFEPTKEDVLAGQDLFSGIQVFENKGPSCISCHNVNRLLRETRKRWCSWCYYRASLSSNESFLSKTSNFRKRNIPVISLFKRHKRATILPRNYIIRKCAFILGYRWRYCINGNLPVVLVQTQKRNC